MGTEDLLVKIERLYRAVSAATETDLSKFPPIHEVMGNLLAVRQDFNRGQSQAELQDKAFHIVRSIADLKDHLRSVARRIGQDPEEVEQTINGCLSLQLMIDLANLDKHGAHAKPKDQRSKRSPRLVNVRSAFQITAKGADIGPGGSFGIFQHPRVYNHLAQASRPW
jgi:hypothetical protein